MKYKISCDHDTNVPERLSVFLLLLRPGYTAEPVKEDRRRHIEAHVDPKQPEIPPARIPIRMNTLQKLVRRVHLTKAALLRRLRISQIATRHVNILRHVLATRLTLWRKESLELRVRAVRRRLTQRRRHEARYEVRERINAVHEDPEPR